MGMLAIIAKPPPGATNDIRAIRPPVEIPLGWLWVIWLLLALAAIALAWWLWKYYQRKRATPPPPPPPVPAHVRALQRLEVALGMLDQPDAFVVAVSSALREYIEERFEVRAPERTTEEFLAELGRNPVFDENQKQGMAAFLEQCDLVKFARFDPGVAHLRQLQQSAVDFVQQTQPQPAPQEVQT